MQVVSNGPYFGYIRRVSPEQREAAEALAAERADHVFYPGTPDKSEEAVITNGVDAFIIPVCQESIRVNESLKKQGQEYNRPELRRARITLRTMHHDAAAWDGKPLPEDNRVLTLPDGQQISFQALTGPAN